MVLDYKYIQLNHNRTQLNTLLSCLLAINYNPIIHDIRFYHTMIYKPNDQSKVFVTFINPGNMARFRKNPAKNVFRKFLKNHYEV